MCRILSLAQDGGRVLRDRPRLREEALQRRAGRNPDALSAIRPVFRRTR
jgi:hypothetical protein